MMSWIAGVSPSGISGTARATGPAAATVLAGAGGPAGTVSLAAAAHEGVLGLLGVAALPPDVIVEQTADGPRYHVPEDWFLATPAGNGRT